MLDNKIIGFVFDRKERRKEQELLLSVVLDDVPNPIVHDAFKDNNNNNNVHESKRSTHVMTHYAV